MASTFQPTKPNKKENVAPPPSQTQAQHQMPLHSNDLVSHMLQLASAYNNTEGSNTVQEAQKSFISDLEGAKKAWKVRADDKMLASVMDDLVVDNKKDAQASNDKEA